MYRELIDRAEAGDYAAARGLVRDLRNAFSSRLDQPLRPELRRYLAKSLTRLLNDVAAAEAFNMRRVARRPKDKGKAQRELSMALLYLKHRAKNSHAIALRVVATKYSRSPKAIEAAITRWTVEYDGGRKLVVAPSPKKARS